MGDHGPFISVPLASASWEASLDTCFTKGINERGPKGQIKAGGEGDQEETETRDVWERGSRECGAVRGPRMKRVCTVNPGTLLQQGI